MLVLVHGAEPVLSRKRVAQLQQEAEKRGALVQEVDCAEQGFGEVVSGLGTTSLFEKEKLLIMRNPLAVEGWDARDVQQALLKASIIFVERSQVKKTDTLYEFVLQHGTVEEFVSLSPANMSLWLSKEAETLGVSFGPGARELLLVSCGQDLERLSQEVRKLATYVGSRSISRDDVVLLVEQRLEPKIFATIDALSAKDVKKATSLLSGHLRAGEHPLQLLSMFAWQLRTLLSVKDLLERGVPQAQIAGKLKLHPFVAQKSIAAAARFSFEELKELYRGLYSLDLGFKTSSGNPELLLYLFVARAATKEKR